MLGQGTWHMGERRDSAAREAGALRLGIELGMTLIDTAEMYADGGAETVTGMAVAGLRERVFLVSKVYPHNAGRGKLAQSCEDSLRRLKTDWLDLYLLHWRGDIPLSETIEGMEALVAQGKIRRWGVSNFDTEDMRQLLRCDGGDRCAVNQVLYHLGSRGVEYDLLPWQKAHGIPIMAYCPVAQGGRLRRELLSHLAVAEIAGARGATATQILLAWCMRSGDVIAIPKAAQPAHVLENAQAGAIRLTAQELARLDAAFPPPGRKVPLDMR
ncbi:MAG: aldo/keto reductase [Clostridia bacterium]|nr:aldo/keto reductase [Clostridia bacterium]